MILQAGNISLRPFQLKDSVKLAQLANNKKIWDNVRDALPHPYTESDALSFIEKTRDTGSVFGITLEGQLCGAIGLHPQEDVYRKSAELGYWLGEPYWGQGIISQAVALIVPYGFERLGMIRIYAGVFEYNLASMRVLEKNGFQKEGISRKAVIKNGQIWDEHRYAITINQS